MIPTVDGKTLKKIDERAESEYGISLLQLMEVAGTRMAEFLRSQARKIDEVEILVICGKGNNGGDGFVMARALHNWGAKVKIYLSEDKKQYKGIPLVNLETCEKLGIEFIDSLEGEQPGIIVDCMFGFGFKGELKKKDREVVEWINDRPAKIFSCDLPSGMNSVEFNDDQLTVDADCTLTFTIPKKVFHGNEARKRAGIIFILDIGIPKPLYEELGVYESIFKRSSWMRW